MNFGNLKGSKLVLVGGLLVSALIIIGVVVALYGGKGPTQLGVTSSSTAATTTTMSSSSSLQFPPPPQQTTPNSDSSSSSTQNSLTTSSTTTSQSATSSSSGGCGCMVTPEVPLGALTIVGTVLAALFLFAFVKARTNKEK